MEYPMRQPDNVRRLTVIPDSKALGQWVKERRDEAGMSQETLGAMCRRTKAFISKIEKASPRTGGGRPQNPTLEFLYHLSRALGTSIAVPLAKLGYLKAEANMDTASSTIRILRYYNELTEEDRQVVEELAKSLWTRRRVASKMDKPKPKKSRKIKIA